MLCAFAARLWWRLDDGALVKTNSQNDHEQEDKNHYRHDDTSVSYHGVGSDDGHAHVVVDGRLARIHIFADSELVVAVTD
jgi:hypothetical protein